MTADNIPAAQQVRKDFPEHNLPSEVADRFATFLGTTIKQIFVGLLKKEKIGSEPLPSSNVSSVYMLLDNQVAIEFRLDGQAGSLGVSFFDEISDQEGLFEEIKKREESFPRFFRTKQLADVSGLWPANGTISSVKAYKLPDNYGVLFTKSLCKNEKIVCFELDRSEDLLIVCRVTKSSDAAPQFVRWEDFPESFPKDLLEAVF